MSPALTEIRTAAIRIATTASTVPMRHFRAPLDIIAKSDDSPVTRADRDTETLIRAEITAQFPDHAIFGEEHGVTGDLDGPTWIIDPIDGTRSFITGSPLFGMLIGHLEAGKPVLGLIQMPALNEMFVGIKGGQATCNDIPIHCRATTRLDQAMIYINEAERLHHMNPALFARLCKAGHTRRMAYDCYPHAMVAAGRIDAVVDCGLEPYDYLPLAALIEAAGGVITDWQGAPVDLQTDGRIITSATPALHDQMLELVNG